MKKYIIITSLCIITSVLIPLLVFVLSGSCKIGKSVKTHPSTGEIKVYFHKESEIKEMELEEYICGVVAAEMPATFELEALKAQAVAARSYALHRVKNPSDGHPNASICTDPAHCKAYKSEEEQKLQWGDNVFEYSKKIQNAVYKTEGEILTYQGDIALTVFHSQAGGGKTESSKDVWGGDVPYLISVESHGEENAPNFYSTVIISFDEFKKSLTEKYPEIKVESFSDVGEIILSEGESVKTLSIGNMKIEGKTIREVFGLRSSCFNIKEENGNIIFEVKGYGHGVGMSQYGANTMAKEGYSYSDILKHYYTGTELNIV